jgi:hypothetical protein
MVILSSEGVVMGELGKMKCSITIPSMYLASVFCGIFLCIAVSNLFRFIEIINSLIITHFHPLSRNTFIDLFVFTDKDFK